VTQLICYGPATLTIGARQTLVPRRVVPPAPLADLGTGAHPRCSTSATTPPTSAQRR